MLGPGSAIVDTVRGFGLLSSYLALSLCVTATLLAPELRTLLLLTTLAQLALRSAWLAQRAGTLRQSILRLGSYLHFLIAFPVLLL